MYQITKGRYLFIGWKSRPWRTCQLFFNFITVEWQTDMFGLSWRWVWFMSEYGENSHIFLLLVVWHTDQGVDGCNSLVGQLYVAYTLCRSPIQSVISLLSDPLLTIRDCPENTTLLLDISTAGKRFLHVTCYLSFAEDEQVLFSIKGPGTPDAFYRRHEQSFRNQTVREIQPTVNRLAI